MKKSITLLFILIFSDIIYSQNQNNKWYFGDKAGMDFNPGNPIALTNGQIYTNEGCSSISNNNGNLLFYTDGRTVWDKNHVVMPNGTGLLGHPSTTQSALIIPDPGNSSLYYVFTIGELGGAMNYSIVDMTLQSGNGDVTSTKNVLLHPAVSEKQTAIQKCDGNIWVISHEYNSNKFYADLITPSGIAPSVSSPVGTIHTGGGGGGTFNSVGYLKISQQGNRLALAIRDVGVFEVFDFDINTGIISNSIQLNPGSYYPAYGVEFSPDGTKLYGSVISGGSVYQFNLMAGSAASIAASATQIGSLSGLGCALQLGPNGKIYIAQPNSQTSGVGFLGVINFPNLSGSSCGFVNNGFNLGGKLSLLGLPNLMVRQQSSSVVVSGNRLICAGQTTTLTATGASTYQWTGGITSSGSVITVSPTTTTKYYITGTGACGSASDSVTVTVNSMPTAAISGNNSICSGQSTTLTASGGGTYSWSNGATTTSITVNPTNTSTYSVTVTVGVCSATASQVVTVNSNPVPTISGITNLCTGESTTLTSGGGGTYLWNDGSTTTSIIVSPINTTTYSVTVTSGICSATTAQVVTVNSNPVPTIVGTTTICSGQSTILTVNPIGNYSWNTGATTSAVTVSPTNTTSYSVTVTVNGCSGSATTQVTVNVTPVPIITGVTTICAGQSTTLTASGGTTYKWDTGNFSTANSISVTPLVNTTYTVIANNGTCSSLPVTIVVNITSPIQAQFAYQISACSSEVTFTNLSQGVTGVYWNFGDGMFTTTTDPSHVFTPGIYTVLMVANPNASCADSTQQTIVITSDTLQKLIIPNVFTPNGDGINDDFKISGLDICAEYLLEIYNRWGQKVFETKDPRTDSWNGLNGEKKKIIEGTYYYLLIPSKSPENTVKGAISLLR